MCANVKTSVSALSDEVTLPLAPNLNECLKAFSARSHFPQGEVVQLFDAFPRKLNLSLARCLNFVTPIKNESQCSIPAFIDLRNFSTRGASLGEDVCSIYHVNEIHSHRGPRFDLGSFVKHSFDAGFWEREEAGHTTQTNEIQALHEVSGGAGRFCAYRIEYVKLKEACAVCGNGKCLAKSSFPGSWVCSACRQFVYRNEDGLDCANDFQCMTLGARLPFACRACRYRKTVELVNSRT